VATLEQGMRTWMKPWTREHRRRIVRPLWHNGVPYSGTHMMLWAEA